MSDVPFDGWWQADNGRWYPPETHPAFNGPGAQEPPAGWWQASDGQWYPPHLKPPPVRSPEHPPAAPPLVPDERAERTYRIPAMIAAAVLAVAGGLGVAFALLDDGPPVRVERKTIERTTTTAVAAAIEPVPTGG